MRRIAMLGAACLLATGCAPRYGYYHSCRAPRAVLAARGAASLLVAFAQMDQTVPAQEAEERAAIERAEEAQPAYFGPIPHLPPRVTAPDPEHVKFDQGAALAALHAIGLDACAERGAPQGYGHARVTFANDGRASLVTIDAPSGMSADAVKCLGDRLGTAQAPPFDGAPITVGSSYLVR